VVPESTARLRISCGVIEATPTVLPQYIRRTPDMPVLKFLPDILNQLRTTAAQAAIRAFTGSLDTKVLTQGRLLAAIVEQFGDDPHWENFMARALSYHAYGKHEDACKLYAKAIAAIQDDASVSKLPDWQNLARQIDRLRSRAQARQSLPSGA